MRQLAGEMLFTRYSFLVAGFPIAVSSQPRTFFSSVCVSPAICFASSSARAVPAPFVERTAFQPNIAEAQKDVGI